MMILRVSIIVSMFCLFAAQNTEKSRWDIDFQYKTTIYELKYKKQQYFHEALTRSNDWYEKVFPLVDQRLKEIGEELLAFCQDSLDYEKWIPRIKRMISYLSTYPWFQNAQLFEWDTVNPFHLFKNLKHIEEIMFANHLEQAEKCMMRKDDECTRRSLNISKLTLKLMSDIVRRYISEDDHRFLAEVESKHDNVKTKIVASLKPSIKQSTPTTFNPDFNELFRSLDIEPTTSWTSALLTANQTNNLRKIDSAIDEIKCEAYKLSEETRKRFMTTINETMFGYQQDLRNMFEVSSFSTSYVGIDVDESIDKACHKLEVRQIAVCMKSIENQLDAYEEITSSIESSLMPIFNELQSVSLPNNLFNQKHYTAKNKIIQLFSQLEKWNHTSTVDINLENAIRCCKKEASSATEEMYLSLQDDDTFYPREEL